MRIYGVDFTSSPGPSRPIAVADCELGDRRLALRAVLRVTDFGRFERGLGQGGRWIAGLDFPFGLPRRLIEARSWPLDWSGYLDRVAAMPRRQFEDFLLLYKESRPPGDKEHRRATDRAAGALSPMKLFGVPVARMFYEGATRLARAPLNMPPCRELAGRPTAVEAYPALVARWLIGRRSYKETRGRHDAQTRRDARRELVTALAGPRLEERYGVRVELSRYRANELVADGRGDLVDAVQAAVQAAWAWRRRRTGFGIPAGCDALEGWIVDPATAVAGEAPAGPP